MPRVPTVYILASRRNGTLYVGVTANLRRRLWLHANDLGSRFAAKHAVRLLVYAEHHATMVEAIRREKQIKAWKCVWKIQLIEAVNPEWKDLHDSIDVLATLGAD